MMHHCTGCHCRRTNCKQVIGKFTPGAVCCRLQTCFDMREIQYTVPVHQVLPPDKLTQASYKL